jgi:hypothetical protein
MVATKWAFAILGAAEGAASGGHQTCGDLKAIYKSKACCGNPDELLDMQVVPRPQNKLLAGTNICDGVAPALPNKECFLDALEDGSSADVTDYGTKDFAGRDGVQEQSGSDVTKAGASANRLFNSAATPIMTSYFEAGLCPVNVHWHLGAEHRSAGQYDEGGKAPSKGRRLAGYGDVRYGLKCRHYNDQDARYTTEYDWKHCVDMHVGDTYEVHWPHSRAGDCGTANQFQTPFYDGVFCKHSGTKTTDGYFNIVAELPGNVGVQAQIFTIINDESYFYPDLMRGMITEVSDDMKYGKDMAHYTGSTTGTSRNNKICSVYTPITWQVDRTCHLISASSFDKMCADMKMQRDDMSNDLHAHGAREVVDKNLAASNMQDGPPPAPPSPAR